MLVFRLIDPSLLCLLRFFEQSDLHGHCSLQWLSIALVCPSTGMRIFNTLLLANLSLHCLICSCSLNFGSNTTTIGPELHSMPINHLNIFLNVSPCKGLVRKSACMSSVGQCSTSNSCFSKRSVMWKNLMFKCRVLFPELDFPFLSKRIALVLSCSNMTVGLQPCF